MIKIILNPDAENVERTQPYALVASWFGCGYLLPAPGTWGSLGALPFGVLLYWIGGPGLLALCAILVFGVGVWAAGEFEKKTGVHDSKMIVVDEVAGMWIPLLIAGLNPILIVLAFGSFRFFDIVKIWPANIFDQKIKNAYGVMGDDVFAGMYAALVVIFAHGVMGF